jgi:hypothetical protein
VRIGRRRLPPGLRLRCPSLRYLLFHWLRYIPSIIALTTCAAS